MSDFKISEESAEEQISNLLEYYDIEIEDFDNENLKSALATSRRKLVKAIRKGMIEIKEEDGTPIVYQHLLKPVKGIESPIRYKEVDGRSKRAMKKMSENDYSGRIYAFLGGLSGDGSTIIERFQSQDLTVAECLGTIFLQV